MAAVRFVYVIEAERQFVKIGFASKPRRRLEMLQSGCPLDLKFTHLWKVVAAQAVENGAHLLLKRHWKRGEWFGCSAEIAAAAVESAAAGLGVALEKADIPAPQPRSYANVGRPSRGGLHLSFEKTKPWIAEGLSRRTWYRRREDAAHFDTIN